MITEASPIDCYLTEIDLGLGLSTIIDNAVFELLKQTIRFGTSVRRIQSRDRYYCEFTTVNGVKILLHRWIMKEAAPVIDHINGDSLDNRLINLRLSTCSRNSINRSQFNNDNISGLHHISFKPRAKSWYVRIVKNRIAYEKGGFKTVEDAIIYHKDLLPKLFPEEYMAIFKLNGYVKE